jgi:hypothetical protein
MNSLLCVDIRSYNLGHRFLLSAVTMNKNTTEANKRNQQAQSRIHDAKAVTALLFESAPAPDPWRAIRKWGERRAGVKSQEPH